LSLIFAEPYPPFELLTKNHKLFLLEFIMCQVCKHNQIRDIDRLLLTGASPAAIGTKYGFSTTVVQRHQQHLAHKMAQAEKRFQASLYQGLLCKLNIVLELVLSVVQSTQAGGDFKLFFQATREVNRIIKLMLKMDVRLDPEMIYCLVASPQWDLQDSLLPDAFTSLVQTRETLKLNLFARCPDPEPEPAVPLETPNAKLATSTPDSAPSEPAAIPPATPAPNWQPPVDNRPPRKRAKSTRLPQPSGEMKIVPKKLPTDIPDEPKALRHRPSFLDRVRRKWEKSGK
jgi:hypothetical protein